MIIDRIVVGPLQTNCYLIADPDSQQGAIIDPGDDPQRITAMIDDHQVEVVAPSSTPARAIRSSSLRLPTAILATTKWAAAPWLGDAMRKPSGRRPSVVLPMRSWISTTGNLCLR